MSQFISDLERELVGAARRRAAGRRRTVLVPRLRVATVLGVVVLAALTVAAVALVRGLEDGSRTGDERPEVPPPTGSFALPAAPVAQPCTGVEQRLVSGGIQHPLSIFSRPPTDADKLPVTSASVPAGTIHQGGARRAAPERFDAALYLVPAAEPLRGGACDGVKEAVLTVCLVVVADETSVRCFSEDEVEGGRAVAVAGGVAYGVVPDRVERVTLATAGESVSATVHDNAFELPTTAKAGDQVRMELTRVRQCRPSDDLLDAVPALRDGGWVTVSAAAEGALANGEVPRWGRRIETGGQLVVWLVADCDAAERACVIAVRDGNPVAEACATADEIRRHGLLWIFLTDVDVGVTGIAPPGTRGAVATKGHRSHELTLTDGVYGELLPAAFAPADPAFVDVHVEFRSR